MNSLHYGIAIRITNRRGAFYTARDEMDKLSITLNRKNKVYYFNDLSIDKNKLSQLEFVIFFDTNSNSFYFGETEKIDARKYPYVPNDYSSYNDEKLSPHKTWILLKSLVPIRSSFLKNIYVYGETSFYNYGGFKTQKTLEDKMTEPRFPRVYVFINDHYYKRINDNVL